MAVLRKMLVLSATDSQAHAGKSKETAFGALKIPPTVDRRTSPVESAFNSFNVGGLPYMTSA